MLDYYHYTKDPSYNDVIIEALLGPTNLGPDNDYMPKEHELEEGNDDLFFWGSAVISAAERNFPQPDSSLPSWLEIGANVFNELVGRWNTSNCNGGLLWQIFPVNPNGMDYKNSVSNGGFFQIAARMARATGNDTYLQWAEKIYDWSNQTGFIDPDTYHVYDGASAVDNCAQVNHLSFTYTSGIYLHGAAVLANHTGDSKWAERASNLVDGAMWFFSPFKNSTDIMYEGACETVLTCNDDMTTFKGFLSRLMWQATQLMPSLRSKVEKKLVTSAEAAANACTGGEDGHTCGTRWYVGGFDGRTGLGQQMCALETIQGLLIDQTGPPLAGKDIKVVRDTKWKPIDTYADDMSTSDITPTTTTSTPTATAEPEPEPTETEDAAGLVYVNPRLLSLGMGIALLFGALA